VCDKQRSLTVDLYRQKRHTVAEICQKVGGMSRSAFYRIVKEQQREGGKR
jgi:hypothetical protein